MKNYIKKVWKELILYIIVAFVSYLVYALIPYFTKQLFEEEYKIAIVGYTACLVSFIFLAYVGNISKKKWQIKFETLLKKDYFNKVINLNHEKFEKKKVGEYISFQSNDINLIISDYLNPLIVIVTQSLRIITNFVVIALILDLKISILLVSISIIAVVLPKSLGKTTAIRREAYLGKQKKYYSLIEEFFNGFKVINRRTRPSIKYIHSKSLNEVADEHYKYGRANGLMWALNGLGSESLNYITFLYLGFMRYKDKITTGFAIAAFQYAQSLTEPVHEILYYLGMVNSTEKMREEFLEFVKVDEEIEKDKVDFFDMVNINNLSKEYDHFSLKDINLKLEKNKKYALIGLNGSGKSTLFNILASYIEEYEGEVEIDSHNLKEIDTSDLIGIMNQDEYIFSNDFKDNITLFDSYDYLEDNIFLEDALEFKNRENNKTLSGGQKKIIALCRLLNTNTEILLLDEPFSAIDESKKESLFKKIMSLNKTIIMITHDIEDNLNAFDNILFMEEGNLIYNLPYEEIKEKREFLELKASNNLSQ